MMDKALKLLLCLAEPLSVLMDVTLTGGALDLLLLKQCLPLPIEREPCRAGFCSNPHLPSDQQPLLGVMGFHSVVSNRMK